MLRSCHAWVNLRIKRGLVDVYNREMNKFIEIFLLYRTHF
jgi:hypothetical protein